MAGADQGAASAEQIARAHAQLMADGRIQFAFAQAPPPPQPWSLPWLTALIKAIAPFMTYIFWGGLIVVGLLIAWFVAREMLAVHWRRRPKAAKLETATAPWRPQEAQARILLEDADRLAAEGRFAEAAHLLLLRTIGDIQGRRPDLVGPALTSRDIGQLKALPESARPAFADIAHVVERSLFGGRAVDAEAFAHCRRAYADFALPGVWA